MAKQRQITFIIGANAKNFKKGLDSAQRRMQRFGRKMKRTGRSLTRSITVPLAAAGGAAVKMASDFEGSLAEAQAQANLTAQQVSFIGDSAKSMAKRTGESLDDIVEAYKFTISAGKNLAESQKIVAAAAEASAAGFGEQRDLVRLTTTAMQAYNDEIDSGRQFMDLLVGAAQVMELQVEKLGPAFQRNVGVAKELNIGMEELLAGIGSVSEIMGDAQRGGRLFQTMITKLLRPTEEAKEAIEGIFGSITNLRESITEEGLLKTMVRLRRELEASSEEGLGLVFSQRSLEAALNFTNREGERTNEILANMGDTAGSTRGAFEDVSKTTEKRFKRALRNLQVAAIELGEILLPVVNDIINAVSGLITRFNDLAVETKKKILIVAGVLGAGGPLLIALGIATTAIAGLIGMATSMGAAVLAGAGVGVVAAQFLADNWDKASRGFAIAMETMEGAFTGFLLTTLKGTKGLVNTISSLAPPEFMSAIFGIDLSEIAFEFAGVNDLIESFEDDLDDNALELARLLAEYKNLEWGSIGESAKNAFNNVKAIIISELKGLLNSQQIQDLLGKLDEMFVGVGGGGAAPEVGEGQKAEQKQTGMGFQFFPDLSVFDKVSSGLKKVKGNTDATKAALGEMTQKAKIMGQAFQSTVTNAIVSFGETLGNVLAGKTGAEGFFNSLLLVVLDFANKFGKLLVAAGVASKAFGDVLENPIGAIIAGTALIALTAAIRSHLQKGPGTQKVNDALITSSGQVVEFHPDDNILAMKDFSGLAMSGAGGGMAVINNYLNMDGRTVFLESKEFEIEASR